MGNRLDQDRQNLLEPKRRDVAMNAIKLLEYSPVYDHDQKCIKFFFGDNVILYYPYSGWHSGKGIKDGRGLKNLLKQIKR